MSVEEDGILQYAESHFEYHKRKNTRWNGRQIHNAFQTAAALAEYEAMENNEDRAKLEVAHFKTVADASHQFDRYIAETIGGNDAERALNDRERADNFKWAGPRDFEQQYPYSYQPPPPPRHWAGDDDRTPPQQQQRQHPVDAAEFEEFQRQKYLRQFGGGSLKPSISPIPKPWPRPEDDLQGEDSSFRSGRNQASRPASFQTRYGGDESWEGRSTGGNAWKQPDPYED